MSMEWGKQLGHVDHAKHSPSVCRSPSAPCMACTCSFGEPGRVELELTISSPVNAGTDSYYWGRGRRLLLPDLFLFIEHIVGNGQGGDRG